MSQFLLFSLLMIVQLYRHRPSCMRHRRNSVPRVRYRRRSCSPGHLGETFLTPHRVGLSQYRGSWRFLPAQRELLNKYGNEEFMFFRLLILKLEASPPVPPIFSKNQFSTKYAGGCLQGVSSYVTSAPRVRLTVRPDVMTELAHHRCGPVDICMGCLISVVTTSRKFELAPNACTTRPCWPSCCSQKVVTGPSKILGTVSSGKKRRSWSWPLCPTQLLAMLISACTVLRDKNPLQF